MQNRLVHKNSYSKNGFVYRYKFNGKESDEEINGEGNSYDFGARIYDGRLGRWMSLDPLQNKYHGIAPYQFCFDNPVIFRDDDGKDGRLSFDKEKRTITLESTVHLYGKDSKGQAVILDKAFKSANPGPRKFIIDGEEWTVLVKVTFTEVNSKTLTDAATKLGKNKVEDGPGSIMNVTQAQEEGKATIQNFKTGDNILEIDYSKNWGVGGVSGIGASGGVVGSSGSTTKTKIHESLHLLGFYDLADALSDGKVVNGIPYGPQWPEDFNGKVDVMQSGPANTGKFDFKAIHLVGLINYVKKQTDSKVNSLIVKNAVEKPHVPLTLESMESAQKAEITKGKK
jgi:RHS repeat-associated protein